MSDAFQNAPQTSKDWDQLFTLVAERETSEINARGITDQAMRRLADLTQVTHLDIADSPALTDEGAQHLARMPQLITLSLGGRNTLLTERAFRPLGELTRLRHFQSCWTQGFTDLAAQHLTSCHQLESVDVMGSNAGDGLIHALAGKANLRVLATGRTVSNAGISELHHIPAFKSWHGGEVHCDLMNTAQAPTRLTIDGPFTDDGMDALTGLDGIASLAFFRHAKAFTSAGLACLRHLPHLEMVAIDSEQCNDEALQQIAAIPRLRHLQAQDAIAGPAGWRALAQAHTLEYIWARYCPNFDSQSFLALSQLPALRGMAISCKQVDNTALSRLANFRALRQFVSIDVSDEQFRYLGQCDNLDSIYCMYCRDTGDLATEHLSRLSGLQTYYAGKTQITDRSLAILSKMTSLADLEFWHCSKITESGVAQLAPLPNLRRIAIHQSSKVSQQVTRIFPESVSVVFSS